MPPSKGPFSANIHLIIPKLSVPIPEGMCFWKMVRGPFRKCTGWGQKFTWNHPLHSSRHYWNLIQCHLLRAHTLLICIRSSPNFLCLYLRACAFWKLWGGPLRKCMRMGQKSSSNHHKDSGRLLSTPLKVNFSEVISPRICIWSFPTLLCVYLRACAFEKGMGSRFENVRV